MIIARVDGGLGNQMFQYAYGSYLARQLNTPLRLDLRSYRGAPSHGYQLDRFAIDAGEASPTELACVPRKYREADGRSLAWSKWLRPTKFRRHKESIFGFDAKHLQVMGQRYLVGYWQSEKFFPDMQASLRRQFQLIDPLSPASQRVAAEIESTESIAVHVRRGDYLNLDGVQHLSMDYYRRAIYDWAAQRDQAVVYVFSNDIQWCKTQFDLPWPVVYVDHNTADTGFEDLALMQRAACNVIANSTFSWWAAWLNGREGKMVYAPSSWFRPGTLDDTHIVCGDWIVPEQIAEGQLVSIR